MSLPKNAAEPLLLAACSFDPAAKRGEGRFGLGELGTAFLGSPGLDVTVDHHAMFHADLRDPVALLRGGVGSSELRRYWACAGNGQASGLLSVRIVAEGIEDSWQLDWRQEQACDEYRGFGFCPPQRADRIPEVVQSTVWQHACDAVRNRNVVSLIS